MERSGVTGAGREVFGLMEVERERERARAGMGRAEGWRRACCMAVG